MCRLMGIEVKEEVSNRTERVKAVRFWRVVERIEGSPLYSATLQVLRIFL